MNNLQLFDYEQNAVRTTTINNEIWFVAKDICNALGIANSRDAVSRVKSEWVKGVGIPTPSRGLQKMNAVNERGVYKLAFSSHSIEAEKFTDWIADEVLPQIRKTGKYVPTQQTPKPELEKHTDHKQ